MRILLDLQGAQTESRYRGIGRYSVELATAIARNAGQHEVWVALCGLLPETIEQLRAIFDPLIPQRNIRIFDSISPLTALRSDNLWRARCSELLRESFIFTLSPDVVHISSMFEGVSNDAVTSAGLLQPAPKTAVSLYDLIPLADPDRYLFSPSEYEWYFRKLRYLTSADLLLAISNHSREVAIRWLGTPSDRIVNIYSGVNSRFKPQTLSAEDRFHILSRHGISRPFVMYSGAIEERKNVNGLIDAFALLSESVRNAHQLIIVGKHDNYANQCLQARVSQAGLTRDSVVYTGFVPDEDLVALYNLCSVFVLPSFEEGFGLPALEAMSCGAATLGSDATSIREVIGFDEALFDPGSPRSIANRMEAAIKDESLGRRLKEHGLRQSLKFTWDKSAQTAISAFEQIGSSPRRRPTQVPAATEREKPMLAFVSPFADQDLPVESRLKLLQQLGRYYRIELIAPAEVAVSLILKCNFTVRTLSDSYLQFDRYDRILYEVGDSIDHAAIIAQLQRYPGTVILNDFFYSFACSKIHRDAGDADRFVQRLIKSHGYSALAALLRHGRAGVNRRFPCNRCILESSAGVLSPLPIFGRWADYFYGTETSSTWRDISVYREISDSARSECRNSLGFGEAKVVCSFSSIESSGILKDAWRKSKYAQDPSARLVLLQCSGSQCDFIEDRTNGPNSNIITVSLDDQDQQIWMDLMYAADIAVQLSSGLFPHPSPRLLDLLAFGIPTLSDVQDAVPEHLCALFLPLSPQTTISELAHALDESPTRSCLIAGAIGGGVAVRRMRHCFEQAADQMHDALEDFAAHHPLCQERRVLKEICSIEGAGSPTDLDLVRCAEIVANQRQVLGQHQLLLDISGTDKFDPKTGIQRVARHLTWELLQKPPNGFMTQPIQGWRGHYEYAGRFVAGMLGCDEEYSVGVLKPRSGDIFVGLDLCPEAVRNRDFFQTLRMHAIPIHFIVFDLLPIRRPELFLPGMQGAVEGWLRDISELADGLICISKAVADDVLEWLDEVQPGRLRPLAVGYSHLGADLNPVFDKAAIGSSDEGVMQSVKSGDTILMVGTVEPRKGHALVLSAMELLWQRGRELNLVIVGQQGWSMEDLVNRIRVHPEAGKRCFWLPAASDELLLKLYVNSAVLLAASEGEGFGLPLVEAAQHGLPIIARDLPVFREVVGDKAFYFPADSSAAMLAEEIDRWLALREKGGVPTTKGFRWLTWAQSAETLVEVAQGQRIYKMWHPASGVGV